MIDTSAIPYGYCHCGCHGLAPIAKETNRPQGKIKGQPQRYILNHHSRRKRLYAFNGNGCWLWTGSTNLDGYATAILRHGTQLVYRQNWIAKNGPVPEGLELDHLCRNRACCNPDHLEAVTHEENCRRGRAARLAQKEVA